MMMKRPLSPDCTSQIIFEFSRALIFYLRARCRSPSAGVSSHISIMARARSSPTTRLPITRTFESLCFLLILAINSFKNLHGTDVYRYLEVKREDHPELLYSDRKSVV